jgi:phosphoglycolate phosphatase-like HAD superfamily hydrolase
MSTPLRKLILFDIDGTLCLTGGAGLRAMNRACAELVGHADALSGIPVAGRTDRIILADVAARIGRALDGELLAVLRDRYLAHLREEILVPGAMPSAEYLGPRGGIKAVMPGIRDLLDALQRRPDVFLGLLTGNFEEGARMKLEHFGLWSYFRCGAYGDDAEDRNALVPIAVERARRCGLPEIAAGHVVVVGDTPHDIACARAAGAIAVGVATGGFTADQLIACRADVVFENLADVGAFLALLH